ncbi:hypothetical protein SAMN06269117_11440 [Balnearium lithotrophicum]|uniref:Helix-turn-helix domain-containing protein n=1 Tax=Balnearium lithotrophicum TaxID=223788 RepID=A0A521CPQ0_9BACT|nr:hypothetical protein [Balnearium lithotrophicum]SMO61393.1 hypothetical protein SAMN06269117_11440 [Balnearium lithotrophicum]
MKTIVYTYFPHFYHSFVAYEKKLRPSAVQVYFALLSLAGKVIPCSPRSYLKEQLPLSKDTIDKAYTSLIVHGFIEERKGKTTIEVILKPRAARNLLQSGCKR